MTLKVYTASIPQHTWPAFGTPAWTARHRKALRAEFNLACARRDSSGGLDRWLEAREPRQPLARKHEHGRSGSAFHANNRTYDKPLANLELRVCSSLFLFFFFSGKLQLLPRHRACLQTNVGAIVLWNKTSSQLFTWGKRVLVSFPEFFFAG